MPAQMPRGRFPLMVAKRRIGGVFPVSMQAVTRPFQTPKFYGAFRLSGVTRDSAGSVLGNCTVHLYQTGPGIFVAQTDSDASGNFTFSLGNNAGYFYLVAYKSGSPDVAGTSVNTLGLT